MKKDLKRNIIINLKRMEIKEKERIQKRIETAFAEVDRLVHVFKIRDSNLQKVVLFGSMAEESISSEDFDIDLAIRSSRYLELLSICLDSPFKVDLIDLDNMPEHIGDRVNRFGKVLYEA